MCAINPVHKKRLILDVYTSDSRMTETQFEEAVLRFSLEMEVELNTTSCLRWHLKEFPFKEGTGLLGGTEPGQVVTKDNIHFLPPGSVIRNKDGSRIIHLHDDLWLYFSDASHCYNSVDFIKNWLDEEAVLCHIPIGR